MNEKAQIRAWLFRLLAELEIYPDAQGIKTEPDSHTVCIKIRFLDEVRPMNKPIDKGV